MSTQAMKPSETSTQGSTNASHLVASLQRGHKPAGGTIITLAGTNSGATLNSLPTHQEAADLEWATLVNSNLQAVNNSIMLGSKYTSHDPGVHVDISEALDEMEHHKQHHRKLGGFKGKRNKGSNSSSSSESDPHSSGSADL